MIQNKCENERLPIDEEGKTLSLPRSPISPRSAIQDSPPASPLRRAKSLPGSLENSDNGKPLFWFRPPQVKRTLPSPRSHRRRQTFAHLPFRPPNGKSSSGANDLTIPEVCEPAKDLHLPKIREQLSGCTETTVSLSRSMNEDLFSVSSVEEDMNESGLRGLSLVEDEVRE